MPKRKSTPQHQFRPGQIVEREIERYQKCTRLIVPRLMFRRAAREILLEIRPNSRIADTALEALQWAAEDYLTNVFKIAQQQASGDNRLAILPIDIGMAVAIEQKERYDRKTAFKARRRQFEMTYQRSLIRTVFALKLGWYLADRILGHLPPI